MAVLRSVCLLGTSGPSSCDAQGELKLAPDGELSDRRGDLDGRVSDGDFQAGHLLALDRRVVVLCIPRKLAWATHMRERAHPLQPPVQILLQVGDDELGVELAELVLAKPISEGAGERDGARHELVRLVGGDAAFTTSISCRVIAWRDQNGIIQE
jgi:hypothetical protein